MPVVHICMLEGRSIEQKKQLAEAITAAMVTIAKTTPEAVVIIANQLGQRRQVDVRAVTAMCLSDSRAESGH